MQGYTSPCKQDRFSSRVKGGKKVKFGNLDEEFRQLLGRFKEELPGIIPEAANPLINSLLRTGQRVNMLAVTKQVGKDEPKLLNHWRLYNHRKTVESRKGTVPAELSMQQTYLHVKCSLPPTRDVRG